VKRKDLVTFAAGTATVIGAGAAHSIGAPTLVQFVTAALALAILAMLIGEATDQVGHRLSPGATGVLQSAVGNLPELFVCLFALRAGLVDVVRAALVGSILANSLLVLGVAIIVGGLKNGTQTFHTESARMTATLLLLAVSAIVIPTLASELHTPAAGHIGALSAAAAVLLLVVFVLSVPYSLRAGAGAPRGATPEAVGGWTPTQSILVLTICGVLAAFVSDWFVAALEPTINALGISQAFAGFVIVAIAGNAVENVVGIRLAAKNRMDYAVSIILNSSLQVALALVPVLVLLSFFIGGPVLTLVIPPLLVAALLLTTLIIAFIIGDGETIWLEGVTLVGLYAIIAVSLWWG
jgi:Ca2+:H+ antiporter